MLRFHIQLCSSWNWEEAEEQWHRVLGWRGQHSYLCWQWQPATPLIPQAFILSLCVPAMACCITSIWIMTFPSAKCVALPSNPIRCIIYCFLKERESLKAPSFSLHRVECAQNITAERRRVFNWKYDDDGSDHLLMRDVAARPTLSSSHPSLEWFIK